MSFGTVAIASEPYVAGPPGGVVPRIPPRRGYDCRIERLRPAWFSDRFSDLRERLDASFWVIPMTLAGLSILAGLATLELDDAVDTSLGFSGGPESARSVLSTIAASMITFTGLVFTVTIVALQLASGQFSPRVMRTFLRDRTSKLALAMFVSTFTYSFVVLRAVREDLVPGISINIAIGLVLVSVALFIHYIHHIVHLIRASSVVASVGAETRHAINRLYPEEREEPPSPTTFSSPKRYIESSRDSGIVTSFNSKRLVAIARRDDQVIELLPSVGDFMPYGGNLFAVHGGDETRDVAADEIESAVGIESERTMQQDVAFGIRQLVDMASKALSPGINDPTSAVQSIDYIHASLRMLGTRPFPVGRYADEDGVVRLVVPTVSWSGYVSLAVDEIRNYGSDSLQVLRRLRAMLEELRRAVPEERRAPLDEELELLAATAERSFSDEHDRRLARRADDQGIGS